MKTLIKIILLALVIGLSACGGGDETTSNTQEQPTTDGSNNPPVASNLSLSSDLTSPYVQVSLIATDSDNDNLSYYLESPYTGANGSGYKDAFIEPGTNQLYVVLKSDYTNNQVVLNYKASDSIEFSNNATVSIEISSSQDNGLGANDEDVITYSQIPTHYFNDSILGSYNNELPSLVDLSSNMPTPGDQGEQSSCVGWAVGYALKSYHERLEMGWELNSPNTIFSPAYIYNQINEGEDKGSRTSEALELIVSKGAATWKNMPYSQNDYLTQPSKDINTHAATFKAKEFKKLTNMDQIKAALINKHPVVIGIKAYSSFSSISGEDSVYDTSGSYGGGHAVTVVGYDNAKYGGAFKIINSYGVDWGDNGYFWFPYSYLNEITRAYVLIDKPNNSSDVVEVTEPTVSNLPNLEVQDWSYSYNAIPGGAGELTYTVINTGTAKAIANFDVSLLLSTDSNFNSSDIYVAYEEVPFELEVGETAYRSEGNEMSFTLPQNLQAGIYYMALWVDDLDEVGESNENDNISHANDRITIQSSSLPDIVVDYWETSWDNNGDGLLEYSVCNAGGTSTKRTDWDITLMLSDTQNPADDANRYLVFFEDVDYILNPGECVYRDYNSPASYNLLTDLYTGGGSVPSGTYYLSLWVDDDNFELESDENNNYSTASNTVSIGNAKSLSINEKKSAFNGRDFSKINLIKQIQVTVDNQGEKTFRAIGNNDDINTSYYQKIINSKNKVLFPVQEKHAMPKDGLR